jgi:iron complex transport system permease protein
MGIPLKRTRFLIIAVTSLLAGCTTAFCGPIAFIGIAIPHIARMLINTSQHKLLVPATIFSGAIILVLCDIISQLPGSQNILPINAITSLMGAPVIIWVILRRKNYQKTFAG